MRKVAIVVVALLVVLVGLCLALLFAPGTACKWQPLGDEGEGECLGLLARSFNSTRCRVLSAVYDEATGPKNDVVISSALEGFVETRNCPDIAALSSRLPSGTPEHAKQLVVAAFRSCREGRSFSLLEARSAQDKVPEQDLLEQAKRTACK